MTLGQELRCLAALLVSWFVVNLITLERSPTVWRDEVMFTEPAVRFLQGHGFTATSWEASPQLPAVFNGPLYSLLLIPWLKLWGIGPVATRSLGLGLGGLACFWLWRLCRRRGLLRSPTWRLVGVAVLLCGFSVVWACRNGRYDALGMLLLVLLVGRVGRGDSPPALRSAAESPRGRFPAFASMGTALLAALLPFAGLYLIPYVVLVGLVGFALGGRSFWRQLLPPALGLALGCGLLALLHLGLGTWAATAAFVTAQTGPSVLGRLGQIPASWCADPSLLPLALFLVGVLSTRGLGGSPGVGETVGSAPAGWPGLGPGVIGLAALVGVPAWMTLAGKYASYYGWMTFVPVLGGVLCVIEQLSPPGGDGESAAASLGAPPSRWLLWTGAMALVAAATVGLPLRLLACGLEWRQRDHAAVAQFVRAQVRSDDVVVSGFETYYAVTQHCRQMTPPSCLRARGGGIPREVTALVGGEELVRELGALEVSGWVPMASYESPRYSLPVRLGRARWYRLTVWRRQAEGAGPENRSRVPEA